jgi:hypothetical protein
MVLALVVACAGLQEKWNKLTPNEQARVIVGGFQKTMSSLFDTGKAYVAANPSKQVIWKTKAVPAFDAANQAIFLGIQMCIEGKGIPSKMYDSIGPAMKAIDDILLLMGIPEGTIKSAHYVEWKEV